MLFRSHGTFYTLYPASRLDLSAEPYFDLRGRETAPLLPVDPALQELFHLLTPQDISITPPSDDASRP